MTNRIKELKQHYPFKKLSSIVADLEGFLENCSKEEEPIILLELCRLMNYVDSTREELYTERLLNHTHIIDKSEIYVEANNLKAWCRLDTFDMKKSFDLIEESIAISNEKNYKRLYLDSQVSYAIFCFYAGKIEEAEIHLFKYFDDILNYGDIELIIQTYTVLSNIYADTNFEKMGLNIAEALKWEEKLNYKWVKGYLIYLQTTWYKACGLHSEGLKIAFEALNIFREQGAITWEINLTKIISTYLMAEKRYDEAILELEKIIVYFNTKDVSRHWTNTFNLISKCYAYKGDFDNAKSYASKTEKISNNLGVKKIEVDHKINISIIFAEENKFQEAIEILENIIVVYNDILFNAEKINIHKLLHENYSKLKIYNKAYEYLLIHNELKIKQIDEEKIKSITEFQVKYESEKKEAQLKELKIDQLNSELKALKSQMNPHFIFNVMSTVDSLIEVGEQDKARKSLRMFSKMMRNTLEQSNENSVLLEDEISLLESYITLEKLLLGDEFNFEIDIDDEIDTSYDTIPAMLLQPIVENAIKHGLKHKLGKKDLKVSFKLMNEALQIEIDDNGIGRIASAKINESRKNHQSFATKSIEDRIQIINEQHQTNISIETIDKYDEQNNSTGTLVLIKITK